MLSREIFPGSFVLVDVETAWRELLLGISPEVPPAGGVTTIGPGDKALCLVEDISIRPSANESPSRAAT